MNTVSKQQGGATTPVVTRTARIWLAADGIAHWQTLPGSEETLASIREGTEALWQLSGQRAVPLLVDLEGSRSITKEARNYLQGSEASRAACAVALLVSSPVSRMIGNFMNYINRPQIPLQLFTTEEKARTWLKGFR